MLSNNNEYVTSDGRYYGQTNEHPRICSEVITES